MQHFLDTHAFRRFAEAKMQKMSLVQTADLFADVYCLEPGQAQAAHVHDRATKLYLVLEGRGTFTLAGERRVLDPGGFAAAPPGVAHGVDADQDERLVVLAVMAPNPNAAPEGSRP